jgi:hypothetical protein
MLLWNGFIKQVTSGLEFYSSKIIFFSFIRTPPTDYDTVFISPFEVSERSKGHFQKIRFVTFDQPLFFRARDIVEGVKLRGCEAWRVPSPHVIHELYRCNNGRELLEGAIYDYLYRSHAYSRAVRAHILTNLILAGIILDEVDLTGKERAETENKLHESERSLILFVKENRTYQSLRAKFKTALHNLEGNQSCGTNIFTRLLP